MEKAIWYHNPEIWVAGSFVVFLALALRYLVPMMGHMLDTRAEKIRDQLEQASRLRAEAAALLASYQHQHEEKLKEAENMIVQAQKDAAALRAQAEQDLKTALDRRQQQAEEKIARAETDAIAQIRLRMIDIASEAARQIITTQLQSQKDDPAVAHALSAIEQQIH
jgi:F-type H+-transporting ATPase subunit b